MALGAGGLCYHGLECTCVSGVNDVLWEFVVNGDQTKKGTCGQFCVRAVAVVVELSCVPVCC